MPLLLCYEASDQSALNLYFLLHKLELLPQLYGANETVPAESAPGTWCLVNYFLTIKLEPK